MRYRYSLWDPVFALSIVAVVAVGIWAKAVAPDVIPLHFNAAGEPDRWGPPSYMNLIFVPLIIVCMTYPVLRVIDLVLLVRKPDNYGMMTHLGGGLAVIMAALGIVTQLSSIGKISFSAGAVMALIGLLYMYMGWLFWIIPGERIPWSGTGGLIPDTPEAKRVVGRAMALGFVLSGVVTIPLGFLPGELSLLSIVPLAFGPLVGIGIGVARAPRSANR